MSAGGRGARASSLPTLFAASARTTSRRPGRAPAAATYFFAMIAMPVSMAQPQAAIEMPASSPYGSTGVQTIEGRLRSAWSLAG